MPPIQTLRQLAVSLRVRRQALGLTQAQLAAKAGVSRLSVVKVESGSHSRAEIGVLLRLLDALDLDLELSPRDGAPPEPHGRARAVDLDDLLADEGPDE